MKGMIVSAAVTVRELANLLESRPVLFVQQDGVLVGSVTNGDFRRGIAAGASLEDSIVRLMNRSPLTVREHDDYRTRLERVKRLPAGFRYLPVLNDRGEVLELVSDKALATLPNMAVIMAGGLGSRLRSLTQSMPKPMLRVGDKPVLQLIIEQFRRAGVSRFVLSVNYRAEVIKEYFKDGSDFEVAIEYLQETERLGTAGCLSLLPQVPTEPVFVMNGDVLTDLDPHDLLRHHRETGAAVTVCLHEHQFAIPYGVIRARDGRVQAIEEKPNVAYSISAGIYVLNPDCAALVPTGQYFDMPALLELVLKRGRALGAYQLRGSWIDIGDVEDFQRANHEYRDPLGSPKLHTSSSFDPGRFSSTPR
jgi:dTDP-glucose pyrophosphorylase